MRTTASAVAALLLIIGFASVSSAAEEPPEGPIRSINCAFNLETGELTWDDVGAPKYFLAHHHDARYVDRPAEPMRQYIGQAVGTSVVLPIVEGEYEVHFWLDRIRFEERCATGARSFTCQYEPEESRLYWDNSGGQAVYPRGVELDGTRVKLNNPDNRHSDGFAEVTWPDRFPGYEAGSLLKSPLGRLFRIFTACQARPVVAL